MQTGDILACSGRAFISRRIITAQRLYCKLQKRAITEATLVSHGAMIIERPDELYAFESTTLNKWCDKKGVQENPYDEWLYHYNGGVWLRRLCHPDPQLLAETRRLIAHKSHSLIGLPYENGIPGALELMLAGIELDCAKKYAHKLQTKNNLFCTENLARVLQAAKVLAAVIRTNKMPPMEFWGNGKLDACLLDGFTYSEPEQIKE